MALPATDAFASTENPLVTNWTTINNAMQTNGSQALPSNNAVDSGAYWDADSFPDGQYAQVKVSTTTTNNQVGGGVYVRANATSGGNGYMVYVNAAASNNVCLFKLVNGTPTLLWQRTATFSNGALVRLEANGDQLRVIYNGSAVGADETNAVHTSGSAGISYSSSDSVLRLDDFEGGALAGASAALTGTALASITEADIVAGGKTIIATLTGDTLKSNLASLAYVGGQTGSFAGTTTGQTINFALTNGLASVPAAGDLVIVAYGVGSAGADRGLLIRNSSGGSNYTLMGSELYADDNFDTNLRAAYRFMPGTPETSVWLSEATNGGTGAATDAGAYTIHVFRNVDTGTPMDTTVLTATGTDGHAANPPAISPVTADAWVYGAGAAAMTTGAAFTSSDLTDFRSTRQNDNNDVVVGAGYSASDTDPAAFGGGGTGTTADSWAALTAVLRPATTGAFDAARQDIIDGMDSAQAEGTGWDAEVKGNQGVAGVVRTSATVVTITLDAQAAYDITAQETITVTVPASALVGGVAIVATPTFTVDEVAGGATVSPDVGHLTLTAYAPAIVTPQVVTPGKGALVLTAYAPTVLITTVVTPGKGALALTSYAPTIHFATNVIPDKGTLVLTGYAPTIKLTTNVGPDVGHLALTAYVPGVLITTVVAPDGGHLTLTSYIPTVATPVVVASATGNLALTGHAPTVATPVVVTPGAGSLALTAYSPSIVTPQVVTPDAGALALTGYAPTVATPQVVTPDAGNLSLTAYAPTVVTAVIVAPDAGHLTLTGYAPVVAVTANEYVKPDAGHLTLTGYTPVILAGGALVQPDTGHLALAAYAPTVAVTDHIAVAPGAGHLALAAYVPVVAVPQRVTPDAGHLVLTGYAPGIAIGQRVTPGTGHLILIGYAPTISIAGPATVIPGTGHLALTSYAPAIQTAPPPAPPLPPVHIPGGAPSRRMPRFLPTFLPFPFRWVRADVHIKPPAGRLRLTGYAPTVAVTSHPQPPAVVMPPEPPPWLVEVDRILAQARGERELVDSVIVERGLERARQTAVALRSFEAALDPALWARMRVQAMRVLIPLFTQWFIVGAALGTRIRPIETREARATRELRPLFVQWADIGARLGHAVAGDEALAERAGPTIEELLGKQAAIDLDLVSTAADRYVQNYAGEFWDKFSAVRQNRLRAAISRAQVEGLQPKQVAEILRPSWGGASALNTATTEMTRLLGGGAIETYRQMGYRQWQWQTVRDNRVDPICVKLQGKTFSITTPFQPAHVKCRCFPRPYGQIAGEGGTLPQEVAPVVEAPAPEWLPRGESAGDEVLTKTLDLAKRRDATIAKLQKQLDTKLVAMDKAAAQMEAVRDAAKYPMLKDDAAWVKAAAKYRKISDEADVAIERWHAAQTSSLGVPARRLILANEFAPAVRTATAFGHPIDPYSPAAEGAQFVGKVMVGSRDLPVVAIDPLPAGVRGYYSGSTSTIRVAENVKAEIYAHELGHHIEFNDEIIRARVQKWLAERTHDWGKLEALADLYPRSGYRGDEIAVGDRFVDAYIGKFYESGASEVLSMGLQFLYADPLALARLDPDMFVFVINTLRRHPDYISRDIPWH